MCPAYPVKRQAAKHGIGFVALDNGFAACADAATLADICGRLSASDVWAFFERWRTRLPSPFTLEDHHRGYGYELAFRQLEISYPGVRPSGRWPRLV